MSVDAAAPAGSSLVPGGPAAAPGTRGRLSDLAALLGPALLAAALSCIDLTTRSIWIDESATASIVSQHGAALWRAMARDGGNMLGYYALLHVLVGWFGDGLVVLRLPSAVANVATVGLVTLIGRRLFDRRVGTLAGVLAAVSLPLVFWGQDARSYAVTTACVAGSYLCLLHLVERPAGRRAVGAWLGYVVVITLALYMSYVAAFVVPAQLLVVVVARRRPWRVAAGAAVAALLCVPLALLASGRGTGQLSWLPRPGTAAWGSLLESVTSAGFTPNFHLTAIGIPLCVLTLVLLLLAVTFGLAGHLGGPSGSWSRLSIALVGSWLVLPIALVWVESVLTQPLFDPRDLLMVLPAVALLLALCVADRRLPRPLAAGALAVLVGLRAVPLVSSYGVSPENWTAATADVLAHARPGDCIAFYPADGRMAFDYVLLHDPSARGTVPRPVLPSVPFTQVKPYVERYWTLSPRQIDAIATGCRRLWLVASHQGQDDGTASSRANLRRYHALASALEARLGSSPTVSFGWAAAVDVTLLPGRPGLRA